MKRPLATCDSLVRSRNSVAAWRRDVMDFEYMELGFNGS
jgi:hypothetical protein